MRRTRILSTVGPACDSPDGIRALVDAGTDAFRLNFSHGDQDSHAAACRTIREVAAATGRPIAILQDLAGPKMRIGPLRAPLDLAAGDPFRIDYAPVGDAAPAEAMRVTCAFADLFGSVRPGSRLLLDDGRIVVEVIQASPDRLDTRVVVGGRLASRKGIHVPGVTFHASELTAKDAADLRAGLAMGVDLVAVSFVQSPDDLRRVRAAAAAAGAPQIPLVAKIERPQAVERIDAILDVADGVMVARGDLGIELPLETVPGVQKRVVRAARARGVPVIVATEVLESMREAPRPTRAEVTDAAHVVDEGADAVMLAGETALGRHPALAVATLDRILREAERHPADALRVPLERTGWAPHGLALCEAAVALAARAGAEAIVAVTQGGQTARMLSALRPAAPILAATASPSTAARLALVWGVSPVAGPPALGPLRRHLRDHALVRPGAPVVFVSIDAALGRGDVNFVHVDTV